MNLEKLWSEGRGPVDYGLFLANGQHSPISPDSPDYALGPSTTYSFTSDHVASIYITHTVAHQEQEIFAGNTPWEGDGFVAVTEEKKIKWFMHLPGTEDIKTLKVVGDTIVVIADTYPISRQIEISLRNPRTIRTETTKKS